MNLASRDLPEELARIGVCYRLGDININCERLPEAAHDNERSIEQFVECRYLWGDGSALRSGCYLGSVKEMTRSLHFGSFRVATSRKVLVSGFLSCALHPRVTWSLSTTLRCWLASTSSL